MAALYGVIYRVNGDPAGQGWYHMHPGPLRKIPNGQGMGSFCQTTLGWTQVVIDTTTFNELIDGFGQGTDFD